MTLPPAHSLKRNMEQFGHDDERHCEQVVGGFGDPKPRLPTAAVIQFGPLPYFLSKRSQTTHINKPDPIVDRVDDNVLRFPIPERISFFMQVMQMIEQLKDNPQPLAFRTTIVFLVGGS